MTSSTAATITTDLVLLDVVMPGLNGYDVCRRIREEPDMAVLPVIMVTALDPEEERVKGLDAGADDFLSKPVNLERLSETLERWAPRHRSAS